MQENQILWTFVQKNREGLISVAIFCFANLKAEDIKYI